MALDRNELKRLMEEAKQQEKERKQQEKLQKWQERQQEKRQRRQEQEQEKRQKSAERARIRAEKEEAIEEEKEERRVQRELEKELAKEMERQRSGILGDPDGWPLRVEIEYAHKMYNARNGYDEIKIVAVFKGAHNSSVGELPLPRLLDYRQAVDFALSLGVIVPLAPKLQQEERDAWNSHVLGLLDGVTVTDQLEEHKVVIGKIIRDAKYDIDPLVVKNGGIYVCDNVMTLDERSLFSRQGLREQGIPVQHVRRVLEALGWRKIVDIASEFHDCWKKASDRMVL